MQPARQDELRQEFSGAWSLCDQTRRVPASVHLAAAEGPASRAAPPKADDGSCFFGGGAVTDLPGPAYVLPVSSHAEIPGSPTTCSEARALRPPSSTFGPDGRAGFGPRSGFGARSEGGFGPEMWRGGGRFGPHFEAESPRYGARNRSKNRPRNNSNETRRIRPRTVARKGSVGGGARPLWATFWGRVMLPASSDPKPAPEQTGSSTY